MEKWKTIKDIYLATLSLLLLPGLNGEFVLLELVAPVRVNLLIVGGLVGGAETWPTLLSSRSLYHLSVLPASVSVDSNVIAGHQLPVVKTVVAAGVLLAD